MKYQPLELRSNTSESHRERFLKVLDYANAAPSILHSKPWLFRMVGDQLSIYRDNEKHLEIFDKSLQFLTVNIGVLLHYIETAMRYFGLEPEIKTFPDLSNSDLIADIRIKNDKTPTHADLQKFNVLRKPWSLITEDNTRKNFDKKFVCGMRESICSEWIKMCCDCESKDLAKLTFDSELDLQPLFERYAISYILDDTEKIYPEALLDYRPYFSEAHAHILLHSPQNNTVSWLQTGRELGNVLLSLKQHGLIGMVVPWEMEYEKAREKLSCIRDTKNYPQLVVRVYAPEKVGDLSSSPVQNLMYFRG